VSNIKINSFPDFKSFIFPSGEVQVSLNGNSGHPNRDKDAVINAKITNSEDLMSLLLVTDALKREGKTDITLVMPYVPYARQDRVCNPGEAHSLKVFASLINAQQYSRVEVFDPHSDVTEALINNIVIRSNHEFAKAAIFDAVGNRNAPFHLISPDAGACKKIHYLGRYLSDYMLDFDIVTCNKEYNIKTGAITSFSVGYSDLEGKPCVIVDDILSRGGTFLGLAKALKERNAGDLYLIVSHDEGVANKEMFKTAGFAKVFKTNSLSDRNDEMFTNMRLF